MAFDFIFKGFTKAIFTANSSLNLLPTDLGEEMIALNFDSDAVRRIRTAIGTIASPELFVEISLTMNILKTSSQYAAYQQQVMDNTIIDGEVTLYDDKNQEWTFTKLSLKPVALSTSGAEASAQYIIQGNWQVNNKLIASLV